MAASRTLLFFISLLPLFTLYWLTSLSHHHTSPPGHNQSYKAFIEALTIFKSNRYDEPESWPLIRGPLRRIVKASPLPCYNKDFNNLATKPWPLLDDEDVVGLTAHNFTDFVAKNKYVLVMYYATWCNWSEQLAPEYAAAAKMLKGEAVQLAMVDGNWEHGLRSKYHVSDYPTIHLFVGGVRPSVYDSCRERTRDAITTWVKMKLSLGIYSINTMDEAQRVLAAESKLVLGFFDSLEGSESEELAAASKLQSDINFYQTASADVAELFHIDPHIESPALFFLHTVTRNYSIFDGQFTRSAIDDFVSKIKVPLVVTITVENSEQIFHNPMKQLWLFPPTNGSEKVKSSFEEAAEAFQGKLLFVYVEMNREGLGYGKTPFHEFGISGDDPSIIAYRNYGAKHHVLNGELNLSSVKSFGEDFLEDKLSSQPNLASETVLKLPSHSHASDQLHFHM